MRLSVICSVYSRSAISIIGCANDIAGRVLGSSQAAAKLKSSRFLQESGTPYNWQQIISQPIIDNNESVVMDKFKIVYTYCKALAQSTKNAISAGKELLVIGGDHSCAMGTWSGVANAIRPYGRIGLIWIDSHMDSHTPSTSRTGNIHGMPVAHLLGHGNKSLSRLLDAQPKIQPENLAMVGIRSYEKEERELLESLKVRVFYDEEVKQRGVAVVMQDAIDIASDGTYGYGVSVDLDVFRMEDAPAVAVPEGDMDASAFLKAISSTDLRKLLALEIVEFLPRIDHWDNRTEKLAVNIFNTIYSNKFKQLKEFDNQNRKAVVQ